MIRALLLATLLAVLTRYVGAAPWAYALGWAAALFVGIWLGMDAERFRKEVRRESR